jgi:hypothetical protein
MRKLGDFYLSSRSSESPASLLAILRDFRGRPTFDL